MAAQSTLSLVVLQAVPAEAAVFLRLSNGQFAVVDPGVLVGATANLSPAAFGTAMSAWLLALPTAPSAVPGWWNNAGSPTFS